MAIRSETKEIRGTTFTVTQLTATRSLKLLNKIGKVLGPSLAHLGRAIEGGGDLRSSDVDFGEIGAAAAALFEKLSDDALFDTITRELLAGVTVQGKDGVVPLFSGPSTATFDAVFADHPSDAYRLMLFALEVNYQDFFGAIAGLKDRAVALMASRVPPPAPGPSASAT
jgi:hypothetical protein